MDSHFNQGYLPYQQAGQGQHQQPPPPHHQQPHMGSFGNLSAPIHQQDSSSHPTLPPLQGQNAGYSFGNMSYQHPGSQSHTPTTPHTPSTSSMAGHNVYQHMSPSNAQPGSMMPPSYNPPYSMSQQMPYSTSTASSMPSATSSSASGLATIRPMPPGGLGGPMNGLPSLNSAGQMGQHASFMQTEEAPTHVVGSQGRRGILPSAPGRPIPPAQGSTQNSKSMIPQKDADGKFPCPHCNKTYLHAKHLKRHLLRHTGDRPYMCHLCKDTFSRSDILKRHFQKCSIRRGNPTGANHLAHQRRNTAQNRFSITQQDGPIGLAGLQEVSGSGTYSNGSPNVNGQVSQRSSRANSIITPNNVSHRNSLAGLGILGSNAPNGEQIGSSAGYQQNMPAYAMPNASNGGPMQSPYAFGQAQHQMNGNMYNNHEQPMSFLGHQSSRFDNSHSNSPHQSNVNGDGSGDNLDWNRMFSQGGQDGYIGSHPANASSQGNNNNIKTERASKREMNMQNGTNNESFLGSLYSHAGAFAASEYRDDDHDIAGFPNWSLDDPLQAKVDGLMHFCFPKGTETTKGNQAVELVKGCLTVENVRHLAEHYTSWHGHWPLLHLPTFKLTDATDGLVMAMLCIGAIYSPKLNADQTRLMMEFVKARVLSSSTIYNLTINGRTEKLGVSSHEIEELQALILIQAMFVWHGEPHQRQTARNEFPLVAQMAHGMGLCQSAPPGHFAYSVLHNVRASQTGQIDVNSWEWQSWLEQEKRNRVMYMLFLTDAALAMYFNSNPQFDPLEIRLTLPADDAAWDARDSKDCASALGIFGPAAQSRNETGSKRLIQPGLREAMRTLLEPNARFQPGATNAYSKFILIHALIVRVIACQHVFMQPDSGPSPFNLPSLNTSTPPTPLSQNDWLDRSGSLSASTSTSGRATPTETQNPSSSAAQQERKRLGDALQKWKAAWDRDTELQYPPSLPHLRRFGFSRDGVHFFFLGRSFLQSTRSADWTAPADVRFKQVLALLKRIKGFVVGGQGMKNGGEVGSVGDIDETYGVEMTLDMSLLFRPFDALVDSPVSGMQTHSL